MTVIELIEELKKQDPDAIVIATANYGAKGDVEEIRKILPEDAFYFNHLPAKKRGVQLITTINVG